MPSIRSIFIDNLRIAMTALVIFHHTAVTYGSLGSWYHYEAPEGSNWNLTLFCVLDETFIMGFFFLIAGYYTPAAVNRKGPWRFTTDRLLRLGVPLLLFGLLLSQLSNALSAAHGVGEGLIMWVRLVAQGQFRAGPLWFAAALLSLSALYVLWRALAPPRSRTAMPPAAGADRAAQGHAQVLTTVLLIGTLSFLLRLHFPANYTPSGVIPMMPGFCAPYIVLYVAGVLAARGEWLERVTARLAIPWLIVSVVSLTLFLAAVLRGSPAGANGGWNLAAAGYAFFEPLFASGVILGGLWLFRAYLNSPTAASKFLSDRAYMVYVIHPPVLVVVTRALHPWSAPSLLKFAVAGGLACAACVAVASVAILLPGARKVF